MKPDKKVPGLAVFLGGSKDPNEEEEDRDSAEDMEDDDDPDGGARDAGEALIEAVKGNDPDGVAAALRSFIKIHQASDEE